MGIREVTKHLKLQKLKCIILAPNCEKIQSKGGLDDAINFIIQTSMEQNVPFVFALGRKALGKAVNKLVPISVVGLHLSLLNLYSKGLINFIVFCVITRLEYSITQAPKSISSDWSIWQITPSWPTKKWSKSMRKKNAKI